MPISIMARMGIFYFVYCELIVWATVDWLFYLFGLKRLGSLGIANIQSYIVKAYIKILLGIR